MNQRKKIVLACADATALWELCYENFVTIAPNSKTASSRKRIVMTNCSMASENLIRILAEDYWITVISEYGDTTLDVDEMPFSSIACDMILLDTCTEGTHGCSYRGRGWEIGFLRANDDTFLIRPVPVIAITDHTNPLEEEAFDAGMSGIITYCTTERPEKVKKIVVDAMNYPEVLICFDKEDAEASRDLCRYLKPNGIIPVICSRDQFKDDVNFMQKLLSSHPRCKLILSNCIDYPSDLPPGVLFKKFRLPGDDSQQGLLGEVPSLFNEDFYLNIICWIKTTVLIIPDVKYYRYYEHVESQLELRGIKCVMPSKTEADMPFEQMLGEWASKYPDCSIVLCNQREDLPTLRIQYPNCEFLGLYFPYRDHLRDSGENVFAVFDEGCGRLCDTISSIHSAPH